MRVEVAKTIIPGRGAGSNGEQPLDTLAIKKRIRDFDQSLAERFWQGDDVESLIHERASFMDECLTEIWRAVFGDTSNLALLAVGGYGRAELHPHSDLDLLILVRSHRHAGDAVAEFVRHLWDFGQTVGHSVRTPRECRSAGRDDLTIITALYDRRYITGSEALTGKLDDILTAKPVWSGKDYFRAKVDELHARHERQSDVEYSLEPNIKTSPGGLRDLQTLGWLSKRQFGTANPHDHHRLGLISGRDRDWFVERIKFLWRVRFGLHILAGREEDRLLFDYQRDLAARLGYEDTETRPGVEHFMHAYYRRVLELRQICEILLQHFETITFLDDPQPVVEPINERFQLRRGYIEAVHENVFAENPSALLEVFVIMAGRDDNVAVGAQTIGWLRNCLRLIDDDFRNDPENTRLFMELLRAPHTLVTQLGRMRRYGVLGRYIPEFGRVIGQMQHDLFHIYTVDAHTMMVIRFMQRFTREESAREFPLASRIVRELPKIELLYIAGFFHDIGKGRGGDHSNLGADDAVSFCRRHGLPADETDLLDFLVRSHLVMSTTAQRKDINDPEVVASFARLVRTEERLNYLYALTVADINATNPTLWTDWRSTLLGQLYVATRNLLREGPGFQVSRDAKVERRQRQAEATLAAKNIDHADYAAIWNGAGEGFFLQHTPGEAAWITERLLIELASSEHIVLVTDVKGGDYGKGATEVFICMPDRENLFADSVMALDRQRLSIVNARIATGADGRCYDSFFVLDHQGKALSDPALRESVREKLLDALTRPGAGPGRGSRRIPRTLKHFAVPTEVTLQSPDRSGISQLTVVSSDRPGLLAEIGSTFVELDIEVHQARINTLGERIEDIFQISGKGRRPIEGEATIGRIRSVLTERLDAMVRDGAR